MPKNKNYRTIRKMTIRRIQLLNAVSDEWYATPVAGIRHSVTAWL